MSQPRTAAGRALNDRYPIRLHDGVVDYDPPFLDDILAIEAEAAAIERERLGPLPRRRRGFSPMVDGIDYDSSEQ